MNFIFDIGNVLITFKPEQFLNKLFNNPSLEKKLNEIIYKSPEWIKLDEGTITMEQACSAFCAREPEYKEHIIKVMDSLPDMFDLIQETIDVLPEIKKRGHKLYFLSNFHKELNVYVQEKYSFFRLFDGGVFSCDVHMIKPDPEIYLHFMDKYGLHPKNCVFFDDTGENVAAAERMGIKGVLFSDSWQIEEFL